MEGGQWSVFSRQFSVVSDLIEILEFIHACDV